MKDKTTDDAPKEEEKETKIEQEVQSTAAEPEKKEEIVTPVETKAKRTKTANPYGAWEKIQQEEDP